MSQPVDIDLLHAFEAFASFGSSVILKEIDNRMFVKMLKDSSIIASPSSPQSLARGNGSFTVTDADLLFNKMKPKGQRKVSFSAFCDVAIPEMAQKLRQDPQVVVEQIKRTTPIARGTVTDSVKFHDDKSMYTNKISSSED